MVEYNLLYIKDGKGVYEFISENDKEHPGQFIYDYDTGLVEDIEKFSFLDEWHIQHATAAIREGKGKEHGKVIWY